MLLRRTDDLARMVRMTWTAPAVTRTPEPFTGDERAMLEGWLDWHRQTLLTKCAGLTGEQLATRSVEPSTLSLLGLVRHMTEVERSWFRQRAAGQRIGDLYYTDEHPDADFDDGTPDSAPADLAAYADELPMVRKAVAALPLDHTFSTERRPETSLRWAYLHMIEEYARHNGHADLLRQCIDGTTGD
jgi:uncharacterized damage-inducible protein DinB